MRVCIVSRLYAPEPAAASFALQSIAAELVARGHEVEVVTTRWKDAPAAESHERLRIRRAPVLRDAQGYVRGYFSYLSFDLPLFVRLLAGPRADVYVVEPPPTTGAAVRVVSRILRRPYVYDAADIWADAARATTGSSLVLRALSAVEGFALNGAARIITISQGVVARLRELGVSRPTAVVGFGVDADEFAFQPHDPAGPIHFVYAGRYSEWQGAGVFIDAFAEVARLWPDARLTFVGNGSERELLVSRANELGLTGVDFLDTVAPSELAPMLGTARASLASLRPGSQYDYAFSSKIYAPLAVGCPVIFCGVGPTSDFIVAANGSVRAGAAVDFRTSDVARAMIDAVRRPLTSTERRALSDWTRTHHSLASVARRAADEIEQAAKRTAHG